MSIAVAQKKSESTAAGAQARVSLATSNFDTVTPAEIQLIQRKSSCACGGGCPRCEAESLGVQPKIEIGEPNNAYELEADRVAEQVMRSPRPELSVTDAPHAILRASSGEDSQADASMVDGEDIDIVPVQARPQTYKDHHSSREYKPVFGHPQELVSGGEALPESLKNFYELRFGRDFSNVRTHGGDCSAQKNNAINAKAFAYSNHIWLGRGIGLRPSFILAHELAHVVQQTQPSLLPSSHVPQKKMIPDSRISFAKIQRVPLIESLPFWSPEGKTGDDIHDEVQTDMLNKSSGLEKEGTIPNGSRDGHGLGLKGRADLYKGKTKVGLFFDGKPDGEKDIDVLLTKPKKYAYPSKGSYSKSSHNPRVSKGKIIGINDGPDAIALGEIKPADTDVLSKGDEQLTNYIEGLKWANKKTNEWSDAHSSSDRWNFSSDPRRLSKNEVGLSSDYVFNTKAPKDDEELYLAKVNISRGKSGKDRYSLKKIMRPREHGLSIKGGLYVTFHKNGLWTYFSRPKDIQAALSVGDITRSRLHMELAELNQRAVVGPLLSGPKKVNGFRQLGMKKSNQHKALRLSPVKPGIQRKKKNPKMEDTFNVGQWKADHAALRTKVGPKNKKYKKTLEALKLIDQAYDADKALGKISGTGNSTLPEKTKLKESIGADPITHKPGSGKPKATEILSPSKKTVSKSLPDIYDWIKGWSNPAVGIFGQFRDKFGNGFVTVANKLIGLKDKLSKKIKDTFNKKSVGIKKGGFIKSALRATGRALVQLGKLLIPHTLQLVYGAIETGAKNKLKKIIDIESKQLMKDNFPEFEKWKTELETYRTQADTYVETIKNDYADEIKFIEDVKGKAEAIGIVIELAVIAYQCGTPPGWGCLKLLARGLSQCPVDAILKSCTVQKEIATVLMGIQGIKNIPDTLAQAILDELKENAPDGLKDVFDVKVAQDPLPNPNDIDCNEPIDEAEKGSENPCFGLFPLFPGNQPTPGAEGKEKEDKKKADKEEKKGEPDKDKSLDPETPATKPEPGTSPGDQTQKGAQGKGTPGATKGSPSPSGTLKQGNQAIKAMRDLMHSLTPEKASALSDLVERSGIPHDKPMTAEEARRLKELLQQTGATAEEMQKLANGQANAQLTKKLKKLTDFLEKLGRAESLARIHKKFQSGKLDSEFNKLKSQHRRYIIIGKARLGEGKNMPILVQKDGSEAVGVVNVKFGPCVNGRITIELENPVLIDRGGRPVNIPFDESDKKADLVSQGCPEVPPQGQPPQGQPPQGQPPQGQPPQGQPPQGQPPQGQPPQGQPPQGQPPQGQPPQGQPPQGQPPQGQAEEGESERDAGIRARTKEDIEQEETRQQESGSDRGDTEHKKESPRQSPEEKPPADGKSGDHERDNKPSGSEDSSPVVSAGTAGKGTAWLVLFEETPGSLANGWYIFPKADDWNLSREGDIGEGAYSVLREHNPRAILRIQQALDGTKQVVNIEQDMVVGTVRKSSVSGADWELLSGELLERLLQQLSEQTKGRHNAAKRAKRIHFR